MKLKDIKVPMSRDLVDQHIHTVQKSSRKHRRKDIMYVACVVVDVSTWIQSFCISTMCKQSLTSLIMSRFTIENNDANVLKGEDYVHHNGVDEDDVFMDE
jgi:hypothetical protein